MKKGILYLLFACAAMLSSCYGTHDCACTINSSGEQYEEYDIEESCSDLSTNDATCKTK